MFVGCIVDAEIVALQRWAGDILARMTFVDDYDDLLQYHNQIIVLNIEEANYRFDLVKQLYEQNNYFVFNTMREVASPTYFDLLRDIPGLDQFPVITGGENSHLKCVSLESFYFFTLTDSNQMSATAYTTDAVFKRKQKPFTYLFLNGADRAHRNRLWKAVNSRGLLDQALWSYLGYSVRLDGVPCDIPMKTLGEKHESPYSDVNNVPRFKDDYRGYATFKSDYWNGQWVETHVVPNQYIDTYFSLIAETSTDAHFKFPTEKTYKPLLAGHPFIILASPGHYAHLHDLGFKTFHPYIDESFDLEPDDVKRTQMIVDEVEKLCNSDLDAFLEKVRDICIYNQQHYINNKAQLFFKIHQRLDAFFKDVQVQSQKYFTQE